MTLSSSLFGSSLLYASILMLITSISQAQMPAQDEYLEGQQYQLEELENLRFRLSELLDTVHEYSDLVLPYNLELASTLDVARESLELNGAEQSSLIRDSLDPDEVRMQEARVALTLSRPLFQAIDPGPGLMSTGLPDWKAPTASCDVLIGSGHLSEALIIGVNVTYDVAVGVKSEANRACSQFSAAALADEAGNSSAACAVTESIFLAAQAVRDKITSCSALYTAGRSPTSLAASGNTPEASAPIDGPLTLGAGAACVAGAGGTTSLECGIFSTTSTRIEATAVGASATATGLGGVTAIGSGAIATGQEATAVGQNAQATGQASTSIGEDSTATTLLSTALGSSAYATTGAGATAIGAFSDATAAGAVALGSDSLSFTGAQATAAQTIAIGDRSMASAASAIALGGLAHATATGSIAIGPNAGSGFANAIVIGNGVAASQANQVILRSANVFTILNNSNMGLGTAAPTAPMHLKRSNGSAKVLVEETAAPASRTLFQLKNPGNTKFGVLNTEAGVEWAFANPGTGFRLSRQGSGVVEMEILNNGNMVIAGALTQNSDVNVKTAIVDIDPDEILGLVSKMPISQWEYKDAEGEKHIGPMAQDFYAAFGLGATNTGISTIDTAGVALVAIKALVEENQNLRQRLARLENQQAKTQELLSLLLESQNAGAVLTKLN